MFKLSLNSKKRYVNGVTTKILDKLTKYYGVSKADVVRLLIREKSRELGIAGEEE